MALGFFAGSAGEADGFVGDDQAVGVQPVCDHIEGEIGLGPGDEECAFLVDSPPEIGIVVSPIKHIGFPGF